MIRNDIVFQSASGDMHHSQAATGSANTSVAAAPAAEGGSSGWKRGLRALRMQNATQYWKSRMRPCCLRVSRMLLSAKDSRLSTCAARSSVLSVVDSEIDAQSSLFGKHCVQWLHYVACLTASPEDAGPVASACTSKYDFVESKIKTQLREER